MSTALLSTPGIAVFGAENSSNKPVSEYLEARKLNLIRLEPGATNITVAVELNQPRYAVYAKNLPIFMAAMDGMPRSLLKPFELITEKDPLLPIALPNLTFNWEFKMAEEVREDLENRLGQHNIATMIRNNKTIYTVAVPSYDEYIHIRSLGANRITPATDESVNISAFAAFRLIHRIFSKFLYLHQYPAFKDKEHFDEFKAWNEGTRPSDMDVDEDEPATDDDASSEKAEKSKVVDDNLDVIPEYFQKHKSLEKVPPQVAGKIISCSDKSIIEGSGIYIPYIGPLAHYDNKAIPKVIREHFLGCLGDNEEEAIDAMETLKAACGVIGNTEAGKVMSHLAICIEIGIKAQARVIPYILNQAYQGSLILGYGFTLSVERRITTPVDQEDLIDSFGKANFHERGLQMIFDHVMSGDSAEVRRRAMKESTTIMLLKRKIEGAWVHLNATSRDTLLLAASLLSFPQPRWRNNGDSILRALHLLNSAEPLPEDLPILPRMILETDRTKLILSAFGEFCPTFKIEGGREVPLNTLNVSNVKVGKGKETETKQLTRIAVKTVPFNDAYVDWLWVKENKAIRTPFFQPKEKSSQENYLRYFSGDMMTSIVSELRKYSSALQPSAPSGGKRSAESGPSERSGKKIKRSAFDD